MTRRLVVWMFLLIVFVVLIAVGASSSSDAASVSAPLSRNGVTYSGTTQQDGDSDVHVAMVPITGTIVDGDSSADGSSTGADDVVRMLDAIAEDSDSWDGVMLELDTPGGSVLASEEMTAAIDRVQHEGIPVLAWMRGTAASAGYYVSAGTDRIVASRNTFTGSIGVILEYYVVEGLAKKVGVSSVTIKSGKLKDIGNPMRQPTQEERDLFQTIIDQAYGQFVGVVAKGRDLDEDEVRRIGDGRVYTGEQAKKLGLVDELGLREDAYDAMAKLIDKHGVDGADLQVTSFARSYGLLEALGADAGSAFDSVRAIGDVAGALRGEAPTHASSGIASLEYRAVL